MARSQTAVIERGFPLEPEFSRDPPLPAQWPLNLGSFCFRPITGSKRSPLFLIRLRASLVSNDNQAGSPFFFASATSFQVTGVETVGCSFAQRIDTDRYLVLVILAPIDESFSRRKLFCIFETTRSGWASSRLSASDRANALVVGRLFGSGDEAASADLYC